MLLKVWSKVLRSTSGSSCWRKQLTVVDASLLCVDQWQAQPRNTASFMKPFSFILVTLGFATHVQALRLSSRRVQLVNVQ